MRRRILVLSSRYPYPVIGGDRLRIYEICRELSLHADLTLLCFCENRDEMEHEPPNDGIFKCIERVYLPKWRSIFNAFVAMLSSTIPLQIAYYTSTNYRHRLQEMICQHDVCLAHLIRVGHYVQTSPIATVLEMTDAISMAYTRLQGLKNVPGIKPLIYKFERKRLLKYERFALTKYPVVSLVSAVDRDFLSKEAKNVLICSNGVHTGHLSVKDRTMSRPVIAFVGKMTALHNLDACYYFAEEILPLVRQYIACTFRIVGVIRHKDATHLARLPGVEIYSHVTSIEEALSDVRLGIAPLRMGSGVQNKILEYMSLSLPVIASPIALEGSDARPEKELLVASSSEEYVQQIKRIWNDIELRMQLASAGFAYVKEKHVWSQQLKPLIDALLG